MLDEMSRDNVESWIIRRRWNSEKDEFIASNSGKMCVSCD